MFYLLCCPGCQSLLAYQFTSAQVRARKVCVRCRRKFDITTKVIIKEFETFTEAHEAHKILSYHLHSDQMTKGTLENILEKFRKLLVEGLKETPTILETENGHRASPHDHRDHLSLFDLCKLGVEIDRLHFTAIFPPLLFHSLCQSDALDTHFIKLSYGTVSVYSSGVVDFAVDFSDNLHVAQLEGILANFIKISGHRGPLQIRLHDRELTIVVPYKTILADKILKMLGEKTKVAFIEQQVKLYQKTGEGIRMEAQSTGDLMLAVNQFMQERIQPGISVLALAPDGDGNVQALEQKFDAFADNQALHDTVQNQSLTELVYAFQDLRKDNELTHERQIEQIQRSEHKLDKMFFEKHTTYFDKKCELIMEKLTERVLHLTDLEKVLGQKKQGLLRYLSHLEKEGKIVSENVKTGKRGRPEKKYKLVKK